jgi:hypothetical protein
MKATRVLIGVTILGMAATANVGCTAHAYGEAESPPPAFEQPPTLVEVEPGIWVVRDYDYPVYYVGDAYWVYRDGVWYRSDAYDHGFTRMDVRVVPRVIVHRNHYTYVHYRGAATARSRVAPRSPRMRPASYDQQLGQQRIDERRRLERERLRHERQLQDERAAAQRRIERQRIVDQRRLEDQRAAGRRKLEQQRTVDQRRLESEHEAAQRKREQQRANERRRREQQREQERR